MLSYVQLPADWAARYTMPVNAAAKMAYRVDRSDLPKTRSIRFLTHISGDMGRLENAQLVWLSTTNSSARHFVCAISLKRT